MDVIRKSDGKRLKAKPLRKGAKGPVGYMGAMDVIRAAAPVRKGRKEHYPRVAGYVIYDGENVADSVPAADLAQRYEMDMVALDRRIKRLESGVNHE